MEKKDEHKPKTPWQIKRSLFHCSEGECDRCDYFDECYNKKGTNMHIALLLDTMEYIHQLEKERDAATPRELTK